MLAQFPTVGIPAWVVGFLVAVAILSIFFAGQYFLNRKEGLGNKEKQNKTLLYICSVTLLGVFVLAGIAYGFSHTQARSEARAAFETANGVTIISMYGQFPLSESAPVPVIVDQYGTLADCAIYTRTGSYILKCYDTPYQMYATDNYGGPQTLEKDSSMSGSDTSVSPSVIDGTENDLPMQDSSPSMGRSTNN